MSQCEHACKVPLLAEHGKHAQVVHHARARLQGCIIFFYCSSFSVVPLFWTLTRFSTPYTILFTIKPHVHYIFCSGIDPPTHQSSSSPFRSVRQSSSLIKSRSREAPSSRSRSRTLSLAHEKLSTFTLSSRFTKSTPVHDPHLNLPFLLFHGFCSVHISDDRWDTRTALHTHTHTELFIRFSDRQVFLHAYGSMLSSMLSHSWPLLLLAWCFYTI